MTGNAQEAWALVDADIYRDGGSYGATLVQAGVEWSLLLQVEPWDTPDQVRHGSLYVSRGPDPRPMERELPIASGEELRWAEILRAADSSAADERSQQRSDELLRILEVRLADRTGGE